MEKTRVKGSHFRTDQLPAQFVSPYLAITNEKVLREKKVYTNEQRKNQGKICETVDPRKKARKQKKQKKCLPTCIV